MTKMDRWLSWGKTAFGPILLVFTFVVYLLTLARDAVVGEPARLIVQHTGLDPFPPLSHFLWGWLAQSVSILTGSYSILFLNFLSAVFGSLSIYFLYEIVVRMPHDRTAEEVESRFPAAPVQAISALVAALVLACGRAIGDTIVALTVSGNAPILPHAASDPLRTLTAHIALVLATDAHSEVYASLFGAGLLLQYYSGSRGLRLFRRAARSWNAS